MWSGGRTAAAGLAALLSAGGCGSSGSPSQAPSAAPGAEHARQAPPLRTAAAASGRLVGAAVTASLLQSDPDYAPVLARHFNYVTAENELKWRSIEAERGHRDYAAADQIVRFALSNGQSIKGHTLIWHEYVPDWFEALPPDQARQAVESHIRATVGRYRGQIATWDVVNEAIEDGGAGLRDTPHLRKLGPDYIAMAFRLAHEVDADALLTYNDTAEGLGAKSDAVYALVRDLVQRGVPIGGVGLQMHLDVLTAPSPREIADNMRRLGELGLRVNISEMDVRIAGISGDPGRLEEQRRVYHDVVAVCLAEPACDAVTFWGFTDAHSWIDWFFGPDDPLLFDDAYRVKPAYNGVLDALTGR
jgi:endo-1,4-beta-xylanase